MSGNRNDSDIDLMLAYDGELEGAAADVAGGDADAELKLQALDEIGDVVRSYVELSADSADERLAGLWDRVSERISANGQSAPARSAPIRESAGLIQRLVEWFEDYRGHFVTGAVSAAAVALIMLSFGPSATETRTVTIPAPPLRTAPVKAPVAQEATPPEVESLEVYQGSGTILTLPGDDGEGSTSVIWLAPEDAEETMEGPI